MFSNWFSGGDLERYRTSPHKQRIDGIASGLLRLRCAAGTLIPSWPATSSRALNFGPVVQRE